MKILILVPEFPLNPEKIEGGVNSALSNLLKGFSGAQIKIRVVTFNREITQPLVINYSPNIDIYYTPESKLPHVVNFAFKGAAVIKKHIRQFNPSVVHYAMSGYILLTRIFGLLNRVQLVTIHGVPFAEARVKINKKEKLVYYTNGIVERVLGRSNIIHISRYSSAQYGSTNNASTIIPNAIHPAFFKLPFRENTSNRLLYVGGIEARKNILYLLQAMKVLMEKNIFYTLEVVGGFTDDNYKSAVLAFIKSSNLEEYVILHGWQSQQELKKNTLAV